MPHQERQAEHHVGGDEDREQLGQRAAPRRRARARAPSRRSRRAPRTRRRRRRMRRARSPLVEAVHEAEEEVVDHRAIAIAPARRTSPPSPRAARSERICSAARRARTRNGSTNGAWPGDTIRCADGGSCWRSIFQPAGVHRVAQRIDLEIIGGEGEHAHRRLAENSQAGSRARRPSISPGRLHGGPGEPQIAVLAEIVQHRPRRGDRTARRGCRSSSASRRGRPANRSARRTDAGAARDRDRGSSRRRARCSRTCGGRPRSRSRPATRKSNGGTGVPSCSQKRQEIAADAGVDVAEDAALRGQLRQRRDVVDHALRKRRRRADHQIVRCGERGLHRIEIDAKIVADRHV